MSLLQLHDIGVEIKQANIIQGIDVNVSAGQILAIVGPNGAGKTTLLRCITGDSHYTHGSIEFAGQSLQQWSQQALARSLSVLPQFSLLNFPYTVDEVVALGRIPHATGVEIDREIVREVMKLMDISYLSGRLYTQVSGGEKQRTHIARVMAQIWRSQDAEHRLLLLDEPTSALDLGHQQQLLSAIRNFADSGVAVVMVVHDINLASKLADQILVLSCGRPVAYGEPKAVLNEALLAQVFGVRIRIMMDPETQKPVLLS